MEVVLIAFVYTVPYLSLQEPCYSISNTSYSQIPLLSLQNLQHPVIDSKRIMCCLAAHIKHIIIQSNYKEMHRLSIQPT